MSSRQLRFYSRSQLTSIVSTGSSVRLMWAAGTPLCQLGGSSFTGNYLLATDRTNSVLTTAQGPALKSTSYCAYGNTPPGSLPVALGYNAEYLEDFGDYLPGCGERGYSTWLRRFLSPDRASVFLPENLNAYAYTAGDPINYNDPSGNLRNPVKAIYNNWKGSRALAKVSKDLKRRIDNKRNLDLDIGDEVRRDQQRTRDIESLNRKIKTTSEELNNLHREMEGLDDTIVYNKRKPKAEYLYESSAKAVAKEKELAANLDSLLEQRSELQNTESQVHAAERRAIQNKQAIEVALARLKYLENKYPALVAKAIRQMP